MTYANANFAIAALVFLLLLVFSGTGREKSSSRQVTLRTKSATSTADIVGRLDETSDNDDPRTMGIVLVDIRDNGILGKRVKPVLERLADMTDIPIELWISNTTTDLEGQVGEDVLLKLDGRFSAKVMKPYHAYQNMTVDLQGIAGGHIGKVHALKASAFDIPIFLDGDVWPCNTNFLTLVEDMIENGDKDVVWTIARLHFGAARGRRNDVYMTPAVQDTLEEYKSFWERNSGTIVAVDRQKPSVQRWLNLALDLYVQYAHANPPVLKRWYTDQAALRESMFLSRHDLNEYLADPEEYCRIKNGVENVLLQRDDCPCACDCTSCTLLHMPRLFDQCAGLPFQE